MSGSDETFVDPVGTRDGAARLTSATESLAGQWRQLTAAIEALNAAKPWGTDEPGQQFYKNYLQEGERAPASLTLDGGGKLIERVRQFGPDVSSAVQGTVDMDEVVAKWFSGSE